MNTLQGNKYLIAIGVSVILNILLLFFILRNQSWRKADMVNPDTPKTSGRVLVSDVVDQDSIYPVVLIGDDGVVPTSDDVIVKSAYLEDDLLRINVVFGGCAKSNDFALYLGNAMALPIPPFTSALIYRKAEGATGCEMAEYRTLSFDSRDITKVYSPNFVLKVYSASQMEGSSFVEVGFADELANLCSSQG